MKSKLKIYENSAIQDAKSSADMLKGDRKEGCSEGQLWWRCGLRIHLSDTIEGRDAEVGKSGRSEGYFHHCPHLYSHHNRCHYRLMPDGGFSQCGTGRSFNWHVRSYSSSDLRSGNLRVLWSCGVIEELSRQRRNFSGVINETKNLALIIL
ncbi:MAG: hypothetical protein N2V77_05170 [Canidatus Methanoxibalbensis ujae]|nr:hypothetical protein [Candidatus Methanoxibalbensis ujae]